MSREDNSFEYTYSAKEQAEIKKIRERYATPQKAEVDKLEQLRRLDESVTKKGSVAALVIGIISAVVMGTGMSLVMTDIGGGNPYATAIGIAIGAIGMLGVVLAYPVYNHIIKKERERVAPEILRLTDELMK